MNKLCRSRNYQWVTLCTHTNKSIDSWISPIRNSLISSGSSIIKWFKFCACNAIKSFKLEICARYDIFFIGIINLIRSCTNLEYITIIVAVWYSTTIIRAYWILHNWFTSIEHTCKIWICNFTACIVYRDKSTSGWVCWFYNIDICNSTFFWLNFLCNSVYIVNSAIVSWGNYRSKGCRTICRIYCRVIYAEIPYNRISTNNAKKSYCYRRIFCIKIKVTNLKALTIKCTSKWVSISAYWQKISFIIADLGIFNIITKYNICRKIEFNFWWGRTFAIYNLRIEI